MKDGSCTLPAPPRAAHQTVRSNTATNILCTVYYTVYSLHCILYSIQCTLYTIQCTVYSVRCTVYSVQCKVYSVQCICTGLLIKHWNQLCVQILLCSVQVIVYSEHFTVYSVAGTDVYPNISLDLQVKVWKT